MAIPSLEDQIRFVDAILLVRKQKDSQPYCVDEILKSRYVSPQVGEPIRADFSIFELLGYNVETNQVVVVFLALKKNAADYDCIDFIPIRDGLIHYGINDPLSRQTVTVNSLKELIVKNKED